MNEHELLIKILEELKEMNNHLKVIRFFSAEDDIDKTIVDDERLDTTDKEEIMNKVNTKLDSIINAANFMKFYLKENGNDFVTLCENFYDLAKINKELAEISYGKPIRYPIPSGIKVPEDL